MLSQTEVGRLEARKAQLEEAEGRNGILAPRENFELCEIIDELNEHYNKGIKK